MFQFGKRKEKTNALWKGIGVGAGLGAGLMFLLDPERGRRRRALARDKALHLAKSTEKILGARSRDLSNRARGAASRVRSWIGSEESSAPLEHLEQQGGPVEKGNAAPGIRTEGSDERAAPPS